MKRLRWIFGIFLVVYVISGAVYSVSLKLWGPKLGYLHALVVAADIFTAGDPAAWQSSLAACGTIWTVTWIIHAISWILIPVVVGFLVGEFVARLQLREQLVMKLRELARLAGMTSEAAIEGFVQDALRVFSGQPVRRKRGDGEQAQTTPEASRVQDDDPESEDR